MNRYFIHNSANDSNKLEVFHYLKNNFQSQTQIIINDIIKMEGEKNNIPVAATFLILSYIYRMYWKLLAF